jgi:hypothetical protein
MRRCLRSSLGPHLSEGRRRKGATTMDWHLNERRLSPLGSTHGMSPS